MAMNRQFFTSVGILFVITAGLYGGVVVPTILSIRDIRAEIAGEHAKIQDRYLRRSELKESLQDLQKVRSGVAALTAVGIRQGSELDFVQALEDAATATHVRQDLQLRTADQKDISSWERNVPVIIGVEGTYTDVLRYLKLIETLPYYTNINSFTMRSTRLPGTDINTAADVRLDLLGNVYWITANAPGFLGEDGL